MFPPEEGLSGAPVETDPAGSTQDPQQAIGTEPITPGTVPPTEGGEPTTPVQGQQPAPATPEAMPLSQLDWEMPLRWTGDNGQVFEVTVGQLIEAFQQTGDQQSAQELGRLVEAARGGDDQAAQELLGYFQPQGAPQQGTPQQGQVPVNQQVPQGQQPPQQPQPQPGQQGYPSETAQLREELRGMQDAMYDRTVNEIRNGLSNYIQGSQYEAIKTEPQVVDHIMQELSQRQQGGVQMTQGDVDIILKKYDDYYKELAQKIMGNKMQQSQDASLPFLGQSPTAPAAARPPESKWGGDIDEPDTKFKGYMRDKIQNMLAEAV